VASDVAATSRPPVIGKHVLAVLHPGAMGAAVAACLVGRGHEVGWLHAGRSEATSQRAAQAGLTPFDDLADLLARSDIVFSICPPHGALEMAREMAGFRGTVVDANAISPDTSALIGRTVTAGGARYVDGGIIGPPPTTAGTTRLYLAGDDGEVANLFAGSALDAVSLTGAPPTASALKMTYAAWTKTTAALLVSIRRTAAYYGVDDDLVNEWTISQPHLEGAWLRACQQTHKKGWRWSYELAEVGRTFAAVGQPEGFGAAASEVFAASGEEGPPDPHS
jgi:3-hydroxyisobutyrate dehydrogenase-like beta-hydroxyacid dehydrogenase